MSWAPEIEITYTRSFRLRRIMFKMLKTSLLAEINPSNLCDQMFSELLKQQLTKLSTCGDICHTN
jgi:hypothetical protein